MVYAWSFIVIQREKAYEKLQEKTLKEEKEKAIEKVESLKRQHRLEVTKILTTFWSIFLTCTTQLVLFLTLRYMHLTRWWKNMKKARLSML